MADQLLNALTKRRPVSETSDAFRDGMIARLAIGTRLPYIDAREWATPQAAISSGKNVVFPDSIRITEPLFCNTDGQEIIFGKPLLMSAAIGAPALYVGATNSSGSPSPSVRSKIRVKGSIVGDGSKASGSAALSMVRATTCDIGILGWSFHSGIRVDGLSLANVFSGCDLRYNVVGFNDSILDKATANIQGASFHGGRIEANESSGVVLSSSDISFFGPAIEGNGTSGPSPEVDILNGAVTGSISFHGTYFEMVPSNTFQSVVRLGGSVVRTVGFFGGQVYGNLDATRFLISSGASTAAQYISVHGGHYTGLNQFVTGALAYGSSVDLNPAWANMGSRKATASTSATGGTVRERHQVHGELTTKPISAPSFVSTDAATGISLYGGYHVRRRLSQTATSATEELSSNALIADTGIYLFKVLGVGRASSSGGRAFESWALVAGGSGTTELEATGLLWSSGTGTESIVLSINGTGGLQVTNLPTACTWDLYIESNLRV